MNSLSNSLKPQTGAEGFSYLAEPQRTKPWFDMHAGVMSASRLGDWMAVSKRDGKPLKSRYDTEQALLYERTFNVVIDHFVTGAMLEGIEYEPVLRARYEALTGNIVDEAGAFYNKDFVASPDGLIDKDNWMGDEGLGGTEFKLLRDTMFAYVLWNGLPEDHYLQVQGNLLASGRAWWDYMASNLKTKKSKIIRVYPDIELHARIKPSVEAGILYTKSFSMENVFDLEEKFILETPKLITNPWNE